MKKIIVTGALGHIGSKLIRKLPQSFANSEIALIDNLSTQRFSSLFNLPNTARYNFIERDLVKNSVDDVTSGADVVIHLAAMTNAAESFGVADALEKNNFGATENVARSCLKNKVPLIFASTTSVYGSAQSVVDENCSEAELQPQSPYATSKLKEERFLQTLAGEGLRVAICRFGTIFGTSPGMRFHTAVNKFCWQAVMGEPLTVWQTALHQKRPYLDLDDACRAVAFIIEKNLFDGSVTNVLTLNATVAQMIDAIKEKIPDVAIKFVETKIMNQLSYDVSDAKFRARGFEPQGNLKAQIAETLSWLANANGRKLT